MENDDYKTAVEVLNASFTAKSNATYIKHVFVKMNQTSNDTISQFITRLKKTVNGCEFLSVQTEIVDHEVTGCHLNQ